MIKKLLNWFKEKSLIVKALLGFVTVFVLIIVLFVGSAAVIGTYQGLTMSDEEREMLKEEAEKDKEAEAKKEQDEKDKEEQDKKLQEEKQKETEEEQKKKEKNQKKIEKKKEKEQKKKEKEKEKEQKKKEKEKEKEQKKKAKKQKKIEKEKEKKQKKKEKELKKEKKHKDISLAEYSLEDITSKIKDDTLIFEFYWINQSGKKASFSALGHFDVTQDGDSLKVITDLFNPKSVNSLLYQIPSGVNHSVKAEYKINNKSDPIKIEFGSKHELSDRKETIEINFD